MKTGYAAIITPAILKKAAEQNVTHIVYYWLHESVTEASLSSFKLTDVSNMVIEAQWLGEEFVDEYLKVWKEKLPFLFKYKEYDLTVAFKKELLWDKAGEYSLKFYRENHDETPESSVDLNPVPPYYRSLLKLKYLLAKSLVSRPLKVEIGGLNKSRLAVRVYSEAAFKHTGYLFKELESQQPVYVESIYHPIEDKQFLADIGIGVLAHNHAINRLGLSFTQAAKILFSFELSPIVDLLGRRKYAIAAIDFFESLADNGVRGVVVNQGENEAEATLACMVGLKKGFKVFNYMNGTKTKSPQDKLSFFDFWFMHDAPTRDLILSYCDYSPEQLPLVGHLLEDIAHDHQYAGTLDDWQDKLAGKKVIALFSSPIFATEQYAVLEYIQRLLENNEEICVVMKRHPAEKLRLKCSHPRFIQLPQHNENQTLLLFDLLQRSSLSIAFGSTVSLQATWFGVPSIDFVFAETHHLSYVDGNKVRHFKAIHELSLFIQGFAMAGFGSFKPNRKFPGVAGKMAEIIKENLRP